MEQFFECQPQIVKQLSRKVRDKSTRDDLLQEVFVKFASGFGGMKHRENLCGYLYRITDTTIADHYRRESRFVAADESVFEKAATAPETEVQYRLADEYLRTLIGGLPPIYREALTLIDLEGRSQKEAARALGVSYSGLKSRVQRARGMLKRAILDCCDYEFDRYGNVVGCCGGR